MSAGPEKELSDLARALGKLVPQAAPLQRDRLMFEAGRRRGRRLTWLYAAGNVLLAGICVFLGYQAWMRPTPRPEVKVVTVYVPERRMDPVEPAPPVLEGELEAMEPAAPEPPSYVPGLEYPRPYGTIRRNMPLLGDSALPHLSPGWEAAPAVEAIPRAGSRPGMADSYHFVSPWR